MRKTLALTTAVAAIGVGLAASPASAACTDNVLNVCASSTTVAIAVEAGTIAIVATPAATNLASVITGTTNVQTVDLGLTTVTDTRLTSTGWTVSAASTVLTPTVTGTAIPASAASFYVPAAGTNVVGTNTVTRAATTAAGAVANGVTLVSSSGSGVNTTTYTPYLKLTIPSGTAALSYTATVTQSVA